MTSPPTSAAGLLVHMAKSRAKRRALIPASSRSREATTAQRVFATATGPEVLPAALAFIIAADAEDAARERDELDAIAVARAGRSSAAGLARSSRVDYVPAAVRAWAKDAGLDVPAKGRYLPRNVVDAWRDAGAPA